MLINEVINDDLRQLVMDNCKKPQELHTRFFNEMFNLGEYQADIATSAQITDTSDVFSSYQVQLPYK